MRFIELTGQQGKRALFNVDAIFTVISNAKGGCTVYGAGDGVAVPVQESIDTMRALLEQAGGGGHGDSQ